MKIEVGDTIRLKSSLKRSKQYQGITFFGGEMDVRPEKLTVREVHGYYIGANNGYYYSFAMLDMRTLRKAKEVKTNEQSV